MGPDDFYMQHLGRRHSAARWTASVPGQWGQLLPTPRASLAAPIGDEANGASAIELSQTLQRLIWAAEAHGRANRKATQAMRHGGRRGTAAAPIAMAGRVVGRIAGGRIIAMPEGG
jgi:hypothetical protein